MEAAVPVTIKDIDGGVTVATLLGRIDIAGAQDIDMPMNVLAGSKRKVVMDLSQVEFLASMGIRSIVLAAKSIMSKRGTCSLVAPAGNVRTVIEFCRHRHDHSDVRHPGRCGSGRVPWLTGRLAWPKPHRRSARG